MNKQYKSLILDMDGTIMSSLEPMELALKKAGEKWGITITEELLFIIRYQPSTKLQEALKLGDRYSSFSRDFFTYYREYDHLANVFPGIHALLEAPVDKGIVTSESRNELAGNLKRLGIEWDLFKSIVCVNDTPYEKPHPYPLLYCVEQMGCTPAQALYLGDSIFDMECAKSAGVDFGLALWGAGSADNFASAQYVFEKPGDVLKYVVKGI